MWWQQNACLWLNGQSVHLLKTKRTWYGGVAFRQGHWDYEAKRDPDWMGRETAVQACLPGLLRRYGLVGWHLRLLLGGPGVLWKRLSLGTPDRQEADALIAGAGLVSEEGRAYAFEAACPAKGDGGLYDWTVGAYPREGVAAICKACHDAGAVIRSIDLLPAFLGRLWPSGTGTLVFQEMPDRQQHRIRLKDGLPLAYEVQAVVPPADLPPFRWLPEGAGAEDWQPAGPSPAVRCLMEDCQLTQATAMLAFL